MIKKGLRKSTGFEVFDSTSPSPLVQRTILIAGPDTGRRLGRLKGGSVARWPAAQGLTGFVVGAYVTPGLGPRPLPGKMARARKAAAEHI